MKRTRFIGASALAVAALAIAANPAHAAQPKSTVTFEGRAINLSAGWGDAHACTTDGTTTQCFRTEAEMDQRGTAAASFSPMTACSATLRLYRSANYGGDVLQLSTRFITLSLAAYGFDNDTSSYRVGTCSARLYDTTTGVTAYPGNTTAGAVAPAMASGWDNRVGSVYIA
jgi:hypothetical protein